MGKRTRYEPGTFCWVDLTTSDPAGAKAFYGSLFGWQAADIPTGDGGTYTLLLLDGDVVAGLHAQGDEERAQGSPPHWIHYVGVADADATAARARELGGSVYGEPFDVDDHGRLAIILDPLGGEVVAWQPKGMIGAGRVNDPGCLTWNELQTDNPEAAIAFYTGLFGWQTERVEQDGRLVYVTIKNAGRTNGGMMPAANGGTAPPGHWLAYFTVPSADEAAARVRELGGAVLAGSLDLPNGRIAVVRDPQGAAFALFEGETDD